MINVIFSETTKNLIVKISEVNIDRIIEKKNYNMFFSNCKLIGYSIKSYGEKNTFKYHKKLQKFLGKNIYYFFVK